MLKYTNFSSVFEFIEKFPYKVETAAEIDSLSNDEIDTFISDNTRFESWESMHDSALYLLINDEDELDF